MKAFDLFAGIGGFRLALEREGYKFVGFCEIDEKARMLYKAYFNTSGEQEYEDATKIIPGELPDFDILCAGFPCQAFSIAGKRRGFEDTRGTLFFEIARIARVKKPTYLLLENVKGLLSHDKGRTFETILKTLDELGYDAEWQVLNSKDFGVPQNRERVFIVGHLRGRSRPKIFPLTEADKVYYQSPKTQEEIYKDNREIALCMTARQYTSWNGTFIAEADARKPKVIANTVPSGHRAGNVYSIDGIAPTVMENHGKVIQIGYIGEKDTQATRVYTPEGISTTLCANGGGWGAKTGLYLIPETLKIRRLTPLECFRLQGFPDDIYDRAREIGLKDSHLYRFTGNSVTVQVVQTIAKKIKKFHKAD